MILRSNQNYISEVTREQFSSCANTSIFTLLLTFRRFSEFHYCSKDVELKQETLGDQELKSLSTSSLHTPMLHKSNHLNLNLESFPEKILEENESNTDSEVDDIFDSPPKNSSKDL